MVVDKLCMIHIGLEQFKKKTTYINSDDFLALDPNISSD